MDTGQARASLPTERDHLLSDNSEYKPRGCWTSFRATLADKETKIMIFIVIDFIFFLLELFFGYAAHSLALVADAFHMLNDIISLFVGLWAVRKAKSGQADAVYTYGWARVELLGGLMNGVFLVALCLSIFLESVQRFVEPQEVKNPVLVLVIGAIGLTFNIFGLFVFHQHNHNHGDAETNTHVHEHAATPGAPMHEHVDPNEEVRHQVKQNAGLGDCTQQPTTYRRVRNFSVNFSINNEHFGEGSFSQSGPRSTDSYQRRSKSQSQIDLPINPSGIRSSISHYAAALFGGTESGDVDASAFPSEYLDNALERTDSAPDNISHKGESRRRSTNPASIEQRKFFRDPVDHSGHRHEVNESSAAETNGHSHGDMNIRGVFLHVVGDALGNIGVMVSAIIIWLAHGHAKYYADPAISLLITGILLHTAIPLCIATAKPLLQASPKHISIEDIEEDVKKIPGVQSCHDMHVWALTPTKYIATFHVCLDFEFETTRLNQYMEIAREIKTCLHGFGVHSSTIQPEFLDTDRRQEDAACLLNCDDDCITGRQCCPSDQRPGSGSASPRENV